MSIKRPRAKDSATLATFPKHAVNLVPITPALRAAYIGYLNTRGDPAKVVPVGYKAPIKEQLQGLYRSHAKKYALDWIGRLRENDDYPYCPMCGNTGREDLEHYLPESHFPEFAFFSFNIIPSCTICNRKRLHHANAPGVPLRMLHPYFDGQILNTPLLSVQIDGTAMANGSITYAMPAFKPAPLLPDGHFLYARLTNHLGRCVEPNSFRRWVSGRWKLWLQKAHTYSAANLPGEIQKELDAEIALGGTNNWTAAFLRGLLANVGAMTWIHQNPVIV